MTADRARLESTSRLDRAKGGLISQLPSEARDEVVRIGDARQSALSLLIGAAIWELAGRALQLNFLPPLSRVLSAVLDLIASGQIASNLAASLVSLVVGYGLAVAGGVTLGLLLGRYRWAEFVAAPYINAFLATPKLVFVPILYSLFGLGRGVQVAVIFLNAFFVIVVNTVAGIRNVDASFVEMARVYGANEGQLFRKVLLPGALPLTMAGLRLGMGRAVKGMISGEMIVTFFGLGALLRKYGTRFDSAGVFAILLVVVGVALLCTLLVQAIERRVTAWMEPAS
jgi:NitT/TauT family transport system permease protein